MTQKRFLKYTIAVETFYILYSLIQTLIVLHILQLDMAEQVIVFQLFYFAIGNFTALVLSIESL